MKLDGVGSERHGARARIDLWSISALIEGNEDECPFTTTDVRPLERKTEIQAYSFEGIS